MRTTRLENGIPEPTDVPDPVASALTVLNGQLGALSNRVDAVAKMLRDSPHVPPPHDVQELFEAQKRVEKSIRGFDAGIYHDTYRRATELLKRASDVLMNVHGRRTPSNGALSGLM